MCDAETVSWPKEFPELKKLDTLLRCGICYEYMKTCMITSCSHNYCSFCIRKYMQYKTFCPTCFEETHEVTLRNNRPLDEVISLFTGIRDKLIRHLRIAALHNSLTKGTESTNPIIESHIANGADSVLQSISENRIQEISRNKKSATKEPGSSRVKGKSIARTLNNTNINGSITDEIDDEVKELSAEVKSDLRPEPQPLTQTTPFKIPSIFCSPKKTIVSPAPAASSTVIKTVSCPVCSVDIPERNINVHLDKCLAGECSPPKKREPNACKRSPIPKRVYKMMSDKDLRKFLKNYGLNSVGDKKMLINRVQRYTVLYNSECDSENPRPISDIIRQLEREEKEEKTATHCFKPVQKRQIDRHTDPSVIEEENKKYIDKNKANFNSLISAMKEREHANLKPTRPSVNKISSDSESDNDEVIPLETFKVDEKTFSLQQETIRIDDMPSTSGRANTKFSSESSFEDDSTTKFGNGVIEKMSGRNCRSPILNKSPVVSSGRKKHLNVDLRTTPKSAPMSTSPQYKYPERSLSPTNDTNDVDMEDDSPSLLDKIPPSDVDCLFRTENDDDSDNSVSLLVDYVETKLGDAKSEVTTAEPSESQYMDPDFKVTDSEVIAANESEDDSEGIFISRRRKRPRTVADLTGFKRELRKRKL